MLRFFLSACGLILLLGGLDGPPAPVRGQTPPGVGLLIRYPDGHVDSFCITVPSGGITGFEVLQQAGVALRVESGGQGVAVCAINGQGCTDPGAPCFCQCQGGGDCLYWVYYHWQNGRWVAPNVGAGSFTARPGAIEGWGWGAPPPVPIGAALCAASAPVASPTPPPPQPPQPTPTVHPPPSPTRRPVPTPTRARPSAPSATPTRVPTLALPTEPPAAPPTALPSPLTAVPTETPTPIPPSPSSVPTETFTSIPTATQTPTEPPGPIPSPVPPTVTPIPNPLPPTPSPILTPIPTPNPQPPTPSSGPDPGGLLAFAAIVGVLLGAMGWLRWRNRGL